MEPSASAASLPRFAVRIAAPDLSPWHAGNTGIPGFTTLDSGAPGPHVGVLALTHGNEIAGAVVLDRMLRAKFLPRTGRLTLGFVNLAAFARFDPDQPTASRFVDEDINRVWDAATLDGPRRSVELDRARQVRPLLDGLDAALDLHSMLWPSDPLILSGPAQAGRDLARAIGTPSLVVADRGHVSGPRLIDYLPTVRPDGAAAACLAEAGQHWEAGTVETSQACVDGLLRHMGMVHATAPPAAYPARVAEVTVTVTATTNGFAFLQPYRGGEVIARRNSLIALDGTTEIRTPHDDCLLVMPSLRPSRGHTAVRLARFV